MAKIGIIGGSGLYDLEKLENKKWVDVDTPFGKPSDQLLTATYSGREVVFLPRHGRGHPLSPSEINYRANIYAMKSLGVEWIISVAACGSLKEEIRPLDFVIPDQFIDRTRGRKHTFFEGGVVAHIGFAHPVCPELAEILYQTARSLGVSVHRKGTYVNMEGPQFSTLAESNLYRSWGMDIIGMTNMSEARLAREAEICYATLAAVTDYDCWRESEESVNVDIILDNFRKNIENAKKIVTEAIRAIPHERKCMCKDALRFAIVTDPKVIPDELKEKLNLIIGKYIK